MERAESSLSDPCARRDDEVARLREELRFALGGSAAALCSGVGGGGFAAAPALASASDVAYRCGTARIALTSPFPNAAAKMSRK
jgi:hypothetical protein